MSTGRDTAPIRMTPMLLTSILAALVCTVLLAMTWYDDTQTRPLPGQPPPASRSGLIVIACATAVAWIAVLIAACRDQIIRHIDVAAARVIAHASLYGEHREQEGIFRGMELQAREGGSMPAAPSPPAPPSPLASPSSLAPSSPLMPPSAGGQVVPFPRPSTSDGPTP